MLLASQIENVIKENLDCEFIEVKGDDGTHFETIIVSNSFKDKSMVKQHQLVYKALGDMMNKDIHALSIKTFIPEQWKSK
jgi:acid stress-induced BolA-like protein IbaG/YrbA